MSDRSIANKIKIPGVPTPDQLRPRSEGVGKKAKHIRYEDPQDLENQMNGYLDNEDQELTSEGSLLSLGGDIGGNINDLADGLKPGRLKCWACDPPQCENLYECDKAVTVRTTTTYCLTVNSR